MTRPLSPFAEALLNLLFLWALLFGLGAAWVFEAVAPALMLVGGCS